MSKMKTSLYNSDGSLCSEAELLIYSKPEDVSRKEWKKMLKEFRSRLSIEDLEEFKKLRRRKAQLKWKAENPEKLKEIDARWYANNSEKALKDNARWRAENPEKAKESRSNWRAENSDYDKKRRVEDPLFRLQNNMRHMSYRVVKQLSLGQRPARTFKWIGCSPEELKVYLESLFTEGMTWENYGKWHVDHIRPICSFTAEEWEQVNHYTNLQPLWAEDNLAKISSDVKQSVRNKNNTKTVEVSEQTPVINKG